VACTLCAVKVIPVFACFVVVGNAVHLFAMFKTTACSDQLTMDSINLSGVELPKILFENIGTCLIDIVTVVVIVLASKKMSPSARKRKETSESDEENVPLRSGQRL
jgi:hypothetical protein